VRYSSERLSNFKELYVSQFLSDLDDPFDRLIRITYVILSPLLGNGAPSGSLLVCGVVAL